MHISAEPEFSLMTKAEEIAEQKRGFHFTDSLEIAEKKCQKVV